MQLPSAVPTPSSVWFRDPAGSLGGFLLSWTWFPCSARTGPGRVRFGAFDKCVSPWTPRPTHRTFPGPHAACRWCSKSTCEAAWRGPRGSGAPDLACGTAWALWRPQWACLRSSGPSPGFVPASSTARSVFKCASPSLPGACPGSSAVASAERRGRVRVISRRCSCIFQYPARELGFPRIFCCFLPHFEA